MNKGNEEVIDKNLEICKIHHKRKKTGYIIATAILAILAMSIIAYAATNPSPPTNVKVALSGTTLTASWTKSISPDVTQYRIHVYKEGTTLLSSLTKYVSASTTSTTITVPSSSDCYTIHMRAMVGTTLSTSVISNKACNSGGSTTPTPTPTSTPPPITPTPTPTPTPTTDPPTTGAMLPTIRFVTLSDTHITSSTTNSQYNRLTQAVNYINNMTDVDFVVELGDVVDATYDSYYINAKSVLSKLKKPYYVVIGNHGDGSNGAYFRKYFGPSEHLENVSGYQLIFVGLTDDGTLHWKFNYSTADKNKPTLIFNHGPVQPDIGYSSCTSSWGDSLHRYACSMRTETDKFTNLLGFYDGHVHVPTNQSIGRTLYVSEDNIGGRTTPTDYIGYTTIKDGIASYSRLYYR